VCCPKAPPRAPAAAAPPSPGIYSTPVRLTQSLPASAPSPPHHHTPTHTRSPYHRLAKAAKVYAQRRASTYLAPAAGGDAGVYLAAGTHTGAVYVWRLGWAELESAAKGRRGGRHASRGGGGGGEGDDATVVSAGTYATSYTHTTHATHATHASSIGDGEGGAAADDGKKVGIEGNPMLTRVALDPLPPFTLSPPSLSPSLIARQLHSLLQSSEYPIVHLALSAAVDPGRLLSRPLSRPLYRPLSSTLSCTSPSPQPSTQVDYRTALYSTPS